MGRSILTAIRLTIRLALIIPPLVAAWSVSAAAAPLPEAGAVGPYNVSFLQGGIGMERSLPPGLGLWSAGAPWTLSTWIRIDPATRGAAVVATLGSAASATTISVDGPRLRAALGPDALEADLGLKPGEWRSIALRYDGDRLELYADGKLSAQRVVGSPARRPVLALAPDAAAAGEHFGGQLVAFELTDAALDPAAIRNLAMARPNFELTTIAPVGVGWPLQVQAWTGLQTPQDPWTLPRSATPPQPGVAKVAADEAALSPAADRAWRVGRWKLASAPDVKADGGALSRPGYSDADWYAATVPGTILTTLIDRGVYPDPDYGLNNMAIPESLSRRDYWYRTEFVAPVELGARHASLTFKGVNYAAEIFLNGRRLGDIRGAFIRGVFDVTGVIRPGARNALAVRVSPPPHPGIPSEESIAYGPGGNGGALALDGPTFIASEGWDWIPGIRDRNTGLWQDVELRAGGVLQLGQPFVVSRLPLPRTDAADLEIIVPVRNLDVASRHATIDLAFEGVRLSDSVDVAPGQTEVHLTAAAFPQLHLLKPRLWWPNGYGDPSLYHLTTTISDATGESDRVSSRFGIRQISYELSLFDHDGRLRRAEVDPSAARGTALIDIRHEAIKQVPNGWALSLTPAGEVSTAVHDLPATSLTPYLAIRVNGVRIAVRGGSWGMDDSRKRISRDRLEPYFRLHREAHVNIIRNWLGQNTEDVFYDLADENGLLVLNDFWESTQNFQLELEDPALFLANARDVISRYRGHPSIAVWFGRNEGVPQPIVNEGLAKLVNDLDGTRLYTGSSNRVNLPDSGPYNYRPPADYFTTLAKGFSVEVGTPSLATLEAIQAMTPERDRWPISDTLAYHDWHFGGNGDVATFMKALERQFGAPTSLEDFERKAQMMNLVDYRAIFEGFFAHLWSANSGRLLWMTHPSWPSNHWQMYSADYDTHAAYYGVLHAAEPLHAQMNLPDYSLAVVNTTLEDKGHLLLTSRITDLSGRVLAVRRDRLAAASNQVTTLAPLDLASLWRSHRTVLVELVLRGPGGVQLSRNLYWQGKDEDALRDLGAMPAQAIALSAIRATEASEAVTRARLENRSTTPVLAAKLTLVDGRGQRILPAYYSDNYISLLPGQSQLVTIRSPASAGTPAAINLRGWNVIPARSPIIERRN